jgi:hypothetical protein
MFNGYAIAGSLFRAGIETSQAIYYGYWIVESKYCVSHIQLKPQTTQV